MKRILVLLLFMIPLFLVAPDSHADEVVLRNGSTIICKIVRVTDDIITIQYMEKQPGCMDISKIDIPRKAVRSYAVDPPVPHTDVPFHL